MYVEEGRKERIVRTFQVQSIREVQSASLGARRRSIQVMNRRLDIIIMLRRRPANVQSKSGKTKEESGGTMGGALHSSKKTKKLLQM